MVKERIVYIDGGICSQLAFYARGLAFERAGYKVKYDLGWFRKSGTDLTGRFIRHYCLPFIIRGASIKEACKLEVCLAKFFSTTAKRIKCCTLPLSYSGVDYNGLLYDLANELGTLRARFSVPSSELDEYNKGILDRINGGYMCGVHCRRGDLVGDNSFYGRSSSSDYFAALCMEIEHRHPGVKMFFFSDEPQWVRDNIIPKLPQDINCEVVDGNEGERCYLDLFLCSHCDCIISSSGSMGRMAWLFSGKASALYTSRVDCPNFPRELMESGLASINGKTVVACDEYGRIIKCIGGSL